MEHTMKPAGRRIPQASTVAFALLALLPAITVLSALCGWRVTLQHEAVGLSLFSATLLFLTVSAGEPGRVDRVFSALLPLLAVVHILFHFYLNRWTPFLLFMIADSVCAWVMFARFAGPKGLKVVAGVLAVLLYAGLLYMFPALFLGFNIGESTVVRSVPSPDGTRVAQVIDDDQGALGGSTLVEIQRGSADVLLLRLDNVKRVYTGRWGEFNDMEIAWQDGDSILINGKTYVIP